MSSPFCKSKQSNNEASLGLEVRSRVMTLCVYTLLRSLLHIEIRKFAEKREKRWKKVLDTIHNTVSS